MTIHVDSSLTPLHEGTTAPGQGAVAVERGQPLHRAVAGAQQQAGAARRARRCPRARRKPVTDLDQLFNTLNPKTRKGLQGFIQGAAEQYAGVEQASSASDRILRRRRSAATDHFFSELVRDQQTFTSFLVETAKAVTTIGARARTARPT